MTRSLLADLPPRLQAEIREVAPWVADYLAADHGAHRPPRALIWACYQRAQHAGVGRTRAVHEAASELGVAPNAVWVTLREIENRVTSRP